MSSKLFYNPFAVLGSKKGFIAGTITVLILGFVAWWGWVTLDGALDLHFLRNAPALLFSLSQSIIDWLILGIALYYGAKAVGGNGTFADHLAAVGLSRLPYILAAIIASKDLLGKVINAAVNVKGNLVTMNPAQLMSPGFIFGSLLMLALSVWSIVILYYGYKKVAEAPSSRMAMSFLIAVIIAEIVSKPLVYLLAKAFGM